MKFSNSRKSIIVLLAFVAIFLSFKQAVAVEIEIKSEEIEQIQEQIEEYQQKIEGLQEQRKIYGEKIELKREEALNLKNQIYILKNQIAERKIEVEEKENEIKKTNLSIKSIQLEILQKKQEINDLKKDLKNILQIINSYDNKNSLEIIFLESSISGMLNHIRYLDSLQSELAKSLQRLTIVKEGLETQENNLRTQLQELLELKTELQNKNAKLESEKQTTNAILDETRGAEWKFQSLLAEVITEHQKTENEIIELEREARKKIAEEKERKAELMEAEGIIVFSWSVPNEGITATFHDPDYPYRKWIGEHSGIDLRASQGTTVRAAASGYVARAKHGGLGYSYIMIIHNDEFSTVYGHISEILVEDDEYVKRGTVIARSGGLPGTSGAGKFSTGPHLHFEVRLNGIPVNPEDYLL